MKNGTLPLGKTTVNTLLAMSVSMLTDPKEEAREFLYDCARALTFRVIRADRGVEEVEHLAHTLRQIAGLASAQLGKSHVLHGRLLTLIDMLNDQSMWRQHYNVGELKAMPYFHESLAALKKTDGSLSLPDFVYAMGFSRHSDHFGPLSILVELRLVTWEEDDDRAITLRLTEAGEKYLQSQGK